MSSPLWIPFEEEEEESTNHSSAAAGLQTLLVQKCEEPQHKGQQHENGLMINRSNLIPVEIGMKLLSSRHSTSSREFRRMNSSTAGQKPLTKSPKRQKKRLFKKITQKWKERLRHESNWESGRGESTDNNSIEMQQKYTRLNLNSLENEPPIIIPFQDHHVGDNVKGLDKFWPRISWLVGLLVVQSLASIILQEFEALIRYHPNVIVFLTMLLGSGGNVGSQSTVIVVRRLATGELNRQNYLSVVWEQIKIGIGAATILSIISFMRTYFVEDNNYEVLAVCVAMFVLVIVGVILGTALPLTFYYFDIDPGHANAAIQVIMDIAGVTLTCLVAHSILDSLDPQHPVLEKSTK